MRKVIHTLICICMAGSLTLNCAGCQIRDSSETDNESATTEKVILHAVSLGTQPQYGMDEFYEQLDALTMRDLGCIVRYDFIPWGDENEKLYIALASEKYDMLPAGTFSDYKSTAQKNAYADLNEYLELVPDLVARYNSIYPDTLKECEIDGKLYGIPQYVLNVIDDYSDGFFYREDLRKEWGLKPITDLNSLEAYLYRAKQEEQYSNQPLITDNRIWKCLWTMINRGKYLEIVNSVDDNPFVVVSRENLEIPVNRFETEEMNEVLQYTKKWYEDGIIDPQILGLTDNEGQRGIELMASDLKPCETNSPIWSIENYYLPVLTEVNPDWEYGYFIYGETYEDHYVNTMGNNTMICITEKSKQKELAIRYIEKIHTDQEYYDLLNYGVEGIHYELKDHVLEYGNIDSAHYFTHITGAGDSTMDYQATGICEQWETEVSQPYEERCREFVAQGDRNPFTTFTLSTGDFVKELSGLSEIYSSQIFPLLCGIDSDVTLNLEQANQSLNDMGIKIVLQNVKQQMKEFLKASGYTK